LSEGHDPNLFDEISHTPLHYALENGHLEVCDVLLAAGADINACEEQRIGNTPIREVAEDCSFQVAEWLVSHGADPNIEGWMRLTALHKAELRNDREGKRVYELLLSAAQKLGHTYQPLKNKAKKEDC
ncbi:MAG: ankyrin repeat domain-containing protein, partial [Candidatus Hydrogenedentes bacterium]|nr:ankyrin repeat domain-containing protein [Candidatus Hydrogenedentota bacterium]